MKRIILLAIIAFSCFALATATYKSADVSAAVVGGSVYSDGFDSADGNISAEWLPFGGAEIKTDYTAMRLNSDKYEWGSHIVNGIYKLVYDEIDVSCTVEFTLNKLNDGGSWLAFSYGTENTSDEFPYASGAIIFYSANYANVFENAEGALKDDDTRYELAIFRNKRVRVAVRFQKDYGDANYYDLSVKYYDADTNVKIHEEECRKVLIRDGYFGFKTHTMQVDLFDFNVYENDSAEPVFSDDFSDSAVSYADSVVGDKEPVWYASNYWNETNLIVGNIGRLDISEAGSGVVYRNPADNATAKGLNVLYTLSAEFYIDEMVNADSGFIIGADASGENGSLIGIREADSEFSVVFRNGNNETLYACDFSTPSVYITVKVYYDKTAEVLIDGDTYYFELDSVGNYLGFKTYGENGSKGAYVDNFSYDGNEYVDRSSPDAKVNFQDTMDNKYYYSTKYWYAGDGATLIPLPPSAVSDSYMIFSYAGEYSCFAPKTRYSDFIVRFDITFDRVELGSTMGIEVGKNTVAESASNSIFVGYRHGKLENGEDGTYYVGNKCATAEGFTSGVIYSPLGTPENIFVKGETYTFMAIVNNGTIRLFVKNVNEDDSVLAYERARFVNVPTDGYMAMFVTQSNVRLDNFSVINLDCEYFSEDYDGGENLQTFRYDFTTGTDFSAISGGTVNKDKTVQIIRGTNGVSTVGKVGANITRIKFADIEAGASYKHGNVEVRIDTANGRILVSDGNAEKIVRLDNDFVYAGAMLQIEETLGNILLSFVSGDKPLAAIINNVYEFEINNDLTAEKIYITSPYIASIKELSVFNLDTNVSIDSMDYVQQNVRKVKEAIQDDGGCSGAISGDLSALFAVVALAGVVLMIKRRQHNV
nr:hypothetical protein [Clostridia bacterium]